MPDYYKELCRHIPKEKIKSELIDRYAFAPDAGFFYLVPQLIVQPSNATEIKALFAFSHQFKLPLVFRAGGTSLSGQSITDGILVDISRYWRNIVVEEDGAQVRVQPGIIAAHVNYYLKKYNRKIGPDPASINAAMMGGILSNNSSGMCCGTAQNSYHTLKYLKFICTDGRSYSTENQADYARFETESPAMHNELLLLREKLISNTALVEKIKAKYKLKNTVGYGLNALLDYAHPLDILAHLLIGAEGTLAFIEEAVMLTVPDLKYKITGVLYFSNPITACAAIPLLKSTGADTLELMDRAALGSVAGMPGVPAVISQLPNEATAILCEFHAATAMQLTEKFNAVLPALESLEIIEPLYFTTDATEQAAYWKMRKGMYPTVAATRKTGATVLLEDIVLPIDRLGEGIVDIQLLIQQFGYKKSIIFGHAKDGNLHFMVEQQFDNSAVVAAFTEFSAALAKLVINKYQGALKGEHGTGRHIAPFVKDEWGEDAYAIMQQVKKLMDPMNLLNPDVIISSKKDYSNDRLKLLPQIEAEADKCIECGYCEHKCPSKDFTLTPRQRIVLRRAIKNLEQEGDHQTKNQLLKQYQFAGLDTCAVDGLCATECPVNINTGSLVKRLRAENHSGFANRIAVTVVKNFSLVESLARMGLKSGHFMNRLFGNGFMHLITSKLHRVSSASPIWMNQLPTPPAIISHAVEDADIVYFVTCISRVMGNDLVNKQSLAAQVLRVSEKAGLKILIPDDLPGNCCGQPFSSKGLSEAYQLNANKIIEGLWRWTNGGKIPVFTDISSCTVTLQQSRPWLTENNKIKFDQLTMIDSIDFVADFIVPRITVKTPKNKIVFHPVCSVQKSDLLQKMQVIGKTFAVHAEIPKFTGCCGMAGDRGFYHPELIAAACAAEAAEVNAAAYDGYYSSGKTCEMALQAASGKNYQSILYLVDEVC
jgi:D-lactate dehydrogenase